MSIHQSVQTLPPELVAGIADLEQIVGLPIFLLVQRRDGRLATLNDELASGFLASLDQLPKKQPVALLIDSPGGQAKVAYQIAMALRRYCSGFTAIVPRYAKSAATLLSLGADTIRMTLLAELGPLDVQLWDSEREDFMSALDEVQALERLHAFSLEAVDRTMLFFLARLGKKIEPVMRTSCGLVTEMMRPLFDKIDSVHYTQMSRLLKVAEEYGVLLLQPRYTKEEAEKIARHLVEHYPEHDFHIDAEEAARFGLKTQLVSDDEAAILELIVAHKYALDTGTTVAREFL